MERVLGIACQSCSVYGIWSECGHHFIERPVDLRALENQLHERLEGEVCVRNGHHLVPSHVRCCAFLHECPSERNVLGSSTIHAQDESARKPSTHYIRNETWLQSEEPDSVDTD